MFEAQLRQLEGIPTAGDCGGFTNTKISHPRKPHPEPQKICSPCLCSMIAWVNLLQRMDKCSDLDAALTATIDPMGISHKYVFDIQAASIVGPFSRLASRFDSGFCSSCSNRDMAWARGYGFNSTKGCGAMQITAKRMLKNIKELPHFTTFLNEELDGEAVAN